MLEKPQAKEEKIDLSGLSDHALESILEGHNREIKKANDELDSIKESSGNGEDDPNSPEFKEWCQLRSERHEINDEIRKRAIVPVMKKTLKEWIQNLREGNTDNRTLNRIEQFGMNAGGVFLQPFTLFSNEGNPFYLNNGHSPFGAELHDLASTRAIVDRELAEAGFKKEELITLMQNSIGREMRLKVIENLTS